MAYGIIYQRTTSKGVLNVLKKDYTGVIIEINIASDSIKIARTFDGWDNRICGLSLEVNVVNDKTDFFQLTQLMYAKEKEYLVQYIATDVDPAIYLFEGFINVEAIQQKYLKYSVLTIVASSYISKTQYTTLPSLEQLKSDAFINTMLESLSVISSPVEIGIDMNGIKPTEDVGLIFGQNHTALNRTGIYKEVYWKGDDERLNCYEIIETILKSFDAYIYWWNRKWYIEHFSSLRKTSKTYYYYISSSTYSPTIGAPLANQETVLIAASDIHSVLFTETSQTLGAIPGLRKLTVSLNDLQKYINFTSNYFVKALPTTTPIPIAQNRQWLYYSGYPEMTWNGGLFGIPMTFKTIKNAILRGISDVLLFNGATYTAKRPRGLFTHVLMRITPTSNLRVSFKYGFDRASFSTFYAKNATMFINNENRIEEPFQALSWYEWRFSFYIVLDPFPEASVKNYPMYAIKYNINTGEWSMATVTPPFTQAQENQMSSGNTIIVPGSDFDSLNDVATVELSAPVGSLLPFLNEEGSDFGIIFCIGTEVVFNAYRDAKPYPLVGVGYLTYHSLAPAAISYFGDVVIETDENTDLTEPAITEGSINEDYLTEEEITIDIADIKAINYKNAVLRGPTYEERTIKWYHPAEDKRYSLVDWLFYYRFRQRNITRRVIRANAKIESYLRPFTPYYDSKDPFVTNRKYLLTAFTYYPISEMYQDMVFMEYDDSTEVVLVKDGVPDYGLPPEED